MSTGDAAACVGWILYDGSCGLCLRWVPFWEGVLTRRGYGIARLQDPWVRAALDLPEDRLLDELRLLFPDGTHIAGADVYRHAMRRIGWAWPMYVFSILPGGRWVFDGAYRMIARHRYRVSGVCRMR